MSRSRPCLSVWLVAILTVLAVSASSASADMNVELSIQGGAEAGDDGEGEGEGEGEEKKDPKEPPTFRAVVSGVRPGLSAKDFILEQVDVDPPRAQPAEKLITYAESDDPLSLVVLVQGDENWMGNETYRMEDDPERLLGAYRGLGPALDELTEMGPPGSRAALILYGGEVRTAHDMAPMDDFGASALPSQEAFKDAIGSPLETGLQEAYDLLTQQGDRRKVLVVVGDGHGQSRDAVKSIKDRADELEELGVESYAIFHQVDQSLDANTGRRTMKAIGDTGEMYSAVSSSDFSSNAKTIVKEINARYYVFFPGNHDPEEGKGFTWDEAQHEFVVSVDGNESSSKQLLMSWTPPPPDEGGSLWWLWLLIILLVVIIVIVIVVKKKKAAEQPEEMPMMPPEPMDVPPPAAPQPQKTVMLGVGGSDDGVPIVGWIVPLTGPNQYQTFKLLQGATKVGTGGEAHIHIQDSYMSTEHAEILCSPVGFTLKDAGSTNGTFVNQNRVDTHELIDNDVFTLGRTDFKFKSIN